jgi:tetratricopeptide (TPR) repeat protein
MSTQSRPSTTRAAAKRRAAARRRNRERIRQIGAIFFVILFVLGTATTLFVFQTPATTNGTSAGSVNVPASTAGNSIGTTPNSAALPTAASGNDQASQLVKQGDDAANAGKWTDAIGYYKAALGLTNGNASIEYQLGKAYIQTKDYGSAVEHLQKSVNLNPSSTFATDANNLINTYKGQVTPGTTSGTAGTAGTVAPSTATTPSTK